MTINNNPLMQRSNLPRFDKILPEHFIPALTETFKQINEKLNKIEANIVPTWEGLCKPLEDLRIDIESTWNVLEHLLSVKNSAGLREAQKVCMPSYVETILHMQQSKQIYEGLKQIKESDSFSKLNNAQKRVIEMKIKKAEHVGVALEGASKKRFNEIFSRIKQLEGDFTNNLIDSTKAFELIVEDPKDTEGWPSALKRITWKTYTTKHNIAPTNDPEAYLKGPWSISLDRPCYQPFMAHCRNRELRKIVHHGFVNRAANGESCNLPIIIELLSLRKEMANLLGFKTFADLSLDSKMAKIPENVYKMIDELETATKPYAKKEQAAIAELAKENGFNEPLEQWDIPFWASRMREKRFNFTDEDIRPYLPFKEVLNGLFNLCNRLFGIKVSENPDKTIPKWHEDVKFFDIFNENNELIAHFYLDPFSRPSEKRGGAWMETCSSKTIYKGEKRLPIIYVECNGTPPVDGNPSLMSFYEVRTLFHEFGHALQGMLTVINESEVGGTNGIEWDAVEIASQFMENWCANRPTLMGMAKHYKTGEPIPEDLFEKLSKSKKFMAASQMLRQLTFAKTDMYLHSDYDPKGEVDIFEVYQKIAAQTSCLKPNPDDHFLCSFNHIFGGEYCAGYYSYKWAEVISADAFAAFEEAGLDNEQSIKEIGKKYRDTILALGGSMHPTDVYKLFRGREATTQALLRHTLSEY